MKKIITLLLTVVVSLGCVFGSTGCRRDNEEFDDTKSHVYVGVFNAGYGVAWLEDLKTRFETYYGDVSFEKDKLGVQVHISDVTQGSEFINQISNSSQEVIFTSNADYYAYVNDNTYSHLFENNYRLIFEEGGHTDKPRDWGVLKIYLTSQLRWDVYQNIEDLTVKFFKQYFRAAADDMLEFYHLEQNWLGVLNERYEGLGAFDHELMSISNHLKEESWPDNFLQQLLGKIDDAYKAIEVYKTTDPVLYTTLHNRINIESFTIRFLRAEIYGKYYGDLKYEWMASLYKDAKALGFKKFEGQVLLDEYFGKLA